MGADVVGAAVVGGVVPVIKVHCFEGGSSCLLAGAAKRKDFG